MPLRVECEWVAEVVDSLQTQPAKLWEGVAIFSPGSKIKYPGQRVVHRTISVPHPQRFFFPLDDGPNSRVFFFFNKKLSR